LFKLREDLNGFKISLSKKITKSFCKIKKKSRKFWILLMMGGHRTEWFH